MKQNYLETIQWYCPNCGTLVIGYKNDNNEFRMTCTRCKCNMLVSISKKYRDIKIFKPEY